MSATAEKLKTGALITSIIIDFILLGTTLYYKSRELHLKEETERLSIVKQEVELDEKISKLARQKDTLINEKFLPLVEQLLNGQIEMAKFNKGYERIEKEMSRQVAWLGEIKDAYEKLYQAQDLKNHEIAEKDKKKSRLHGLPHLELMLDLCRDCLCELTGGRSPHVEECRRLFTVAKTLHPNATKVQVTPNYGCNIRSKPEKNENVVGTVLQGTLLTVRTCRFSWYEVEVDPRDWLVHEGTQNVGWVWDKLVDPIEEGFLKDRKLPKT